MAPSEGIFGAPPSFLPVEALLFDTLILSFSFSTFSSSRDPITRRNSWNPSSSLLPLLLSLPFSLLTLTSPVVTGAFCRAWLLSESAPAADPCLLPPLDDCRDILLFFRCDNDAFDCCLSICCNALILSAFDNFLVGWCSCLYCCFSLMPLTIDSFSPLILPQPTMGPLWFCSCCCSSSSLLFPKGEMLGCLSLSFPTGEMLGNAWILTLSMLALR
mmetsp:Transcript_3683/g.9348  ORF Transcript_3683/g.9348 Transcript_3683/m.9348 type:complete len:216 (-) Transcript_3683:1391-2038(-)